MRYLIAAALVVSPLMLNAQTTTSVQNPHLAAMQSSVAAANMMSSASASAADRVASIVTPQRVSTGVVEPKLVHTADIRQDTIGASSKNSWRYATLTMVVNEEGVPTDLKIVKSAGPDLDPQILEAVSQYRFQPATVTGQKVAMPLNLNMQIRLAR